MRAGLGEEPGHLPASPVGPVRHAITLGYAGGGHIRAPVSGDPQISRMMPVAVQVPAVKRRVLEVHVVVARQAEDEGIAFQRQDALQDLVLC